MPTVEATAIARRRPLPSTTATNIEYPAFLAPGSDEFLRTLGADTGVLRHALKTAPSSLALNFRPGEPLSHAVQGTGTPTCNLLLRVRRRRIRSSIDKGATAAAMQTEIDDRGSTKMKAEIVAVLNQTYSFDSIADFQYQLYGTGRASGQVMESADAAAAIDPLQQAEVSNAREHAQDAQRNTATVSSAVESLPLLKG